MIRDPIAINIEIGYTEYPFDNSSVPASAAEGGVAYGATDSYTQLRNLLSGTGASDVVSAVNDLPATSSLNGQTNFFVASSEAKAFGQISASATAIDGYTGFGSGIASDAIVGVALHEFTHAMGRVPGQDVFSLFRYTSAGNHSFSNSIPAPATYFSVDGGKTVLADFGKSSDPSDFLNNSLTVNDPFDEFYTPGSTLQSLTSLDQTMLDMLGFGNGGGGGTVTAFSLGNFAPNAGGWTSQDAYPRALGDVNGDGKADIVGFGSNGAYVSLATGGGKFASPILASAAFGANNGWTSENIYPREVGDVTGDGKADIVGFGAGGVYASLSNGDGTFGSPILASTSFGASNGWTSQDQYPRELADVTGNGRADIVAFASDGVYVSLSNGDGTFGSPILASTSFGANNGWTSQTQYPRELADVTGNGKEDIVAFASNGVYVSLANGDGTFAAPILATPSFGTANGWTSNDTYPRELADVNGDGKADIVAFGADGVYTALSNGDGTFQSPVFDFNDLTPSAGGWTSQNTYPRLTGDVTGDGRADIVAFASNGVYVADGSLIFPAHTTTS